MGLLSMTLMAAVFNTQVSLAWILAHLYSDANRQLLQTARDEIASCPDLTKYAELEKLQAEEAAARRRICEGLCGPTLAPLLQDACARVSTHLDAAATGCESLLEATEDRLRAMREAPPLVEFIQRDCVIAATAPFALIAEGLNCLAPPPPPPAAAPAPAPEQPDGWVALDNKFDVFVCTNV